MWFVFASIGLVLAIVVCRIFVRRTQQALMDVLGPSTPVIRYFKRIYLVLLLTAPIGMILYLVVALVTSTRWNLTETFVYQYFAALPFWLVLIWTAQVAILWFTLDLIIWVAGRLRPASNWRVHRHKLYLIIATVFFVVIPFKVFVADQEIQVNRWDIPSPHSELNQFKIIFISDIQVDDYTRQSTLDELTRKVNKENPDLILIAGDFITSGEKHIETAALVAGKFKAKYGVYSCVGDHENFVDFRNHPYGVKKVTEALKRNGVSMLQDQHLETGPQKTIRVSFVNSNYIQKFDGNKTNALLAQPSTSPVRIVVSHQVNQELLTVAGKHKTNLVLAGHTHGGQVSFWYPFVDLNVARVETPYLEGWYNEATDLLVSAGIGKSVAPFRYRVPPAIDVITFKKK